MMRGFGLIALLLVLLIVGWLSTRQVAMVPSLPAASGASAPLNVRQQSQQIEQQVKDQVEKAMQPRNDVPDDAK